MKTPSVPNEMFSGMKHRGLVALFRVASNARDQSPAMDCTDGFLTTAFYAVHLTILSMAMLYVLYLG